MRTEDDFDEDALDERLARISALSGMFGVPAAFEAGLAMMLSVRLEKVDCYRGVDVYVMFIRNAAVFFVWMEKWYSSESLEALMEVVDLWWSLRAN